VLLLGQQGGRRRGGSLTTNARHDTTPHRTTRQGYIYAGVIVAMGLVQLMLHHQVQFMGWRLGLAMRTSLEAAVFRKVLRMPLRSVCRSVMSVERACLHACTHAIRQSMNR
jgi:hypothetical protein